MNITPTPTIQLVELRFGRNYKAYTSRGLETLALDSDRWLTFQDAAAGALGVAQRSLQVPTLDSLEQWVEVHTSTRGQYQGETEESAVATLYTSAESIDDTVRAVLETYAAVLARVFAQDSVAVVIDGRSTLVKANAANGSEAWAAMVGAVDRLAGREAMAA
jgi:hypothetical protein